MSHTPINPLDYAIPEGKRRKTRRWAWSAIAAICAVSFLTPDCVIVYEPLANHRGDGHVEFVGKVQAATILTQIAAGKPMVRYPVVPAMNPTGR